MSHSWEHGTTRFIGNGDLSGPITIINGLGERIRVPGRDLVEFVAAHVARERISLLEQQEADQIFGITPPYPYRLSATHDSQEVE